MILLYILSVILGMLLFASLVGAFLPKEHSVTVKRKIDAPIEKIWDLLDKDLDSAKWRSNIQSVEQLEDFHGYFAYKESKSRHNEISFAVLEKEPMRFIKKRIIYNNNFGGTWSITLEQEKDAVNISITEDGEIYNPIFRLLSKFAFDLRSTMNIYLADLEKVAQQ